MCIRYFIFIGMLTFALSACSKDNTSFVLPDDSIDFFGMEGKDTLQIPLAILADSVIVFELKAELTGITSGSEHWVNFAVDTTKLIEYRIRFGQAELLPSSSYLFFKPMTRIGAGSGVSESAELNIVQQTKLKGNTTYVLPVVIQSVDGRPEGAASDRVLYYIFKTGKPAFISKQGWTILDFSSSFNAFVPANVLDDNNATTYWTSNITQLMPQWVSINFNTDVTFSAVQYYLPTALNYPNLGGYPSMIKIETSADGLLWDDRGSYAGNIAANMQTLETGEITARYLRFTSLEAVKYAGVYDAVFIAGISLVP